MIKRLGYGMKKRWRRINMNQAELKAGRELDALIAEKVMGWHRKTENEIYPYWYDEIGLVTKLAEDIPSWSDGFANYAWSPSTNISSAWEVVEKFRKGNFFLRITPTEEGYRVTACSDEGLPLAFDKKTGDYDWDSKYSEAYADAPTAPLAICRAALKAVEEK